MNPVTVFAQALGSISVGFFLCWLALTIWRRWRRRNRRRWD